MASNLLKRTAAGGLLAVSALLAIPAVASADTVVLQGTNDSGGYNYINVNTGLTFTSSVYLGKRFETSCTRPEAVEP